MSDVRGVYEIYSKVDSKRYIGSSKNIKKRWRCHLSDLTHNRHSNQHLQHAWNRYGEDNFVFRMLEETADLLEVEQGWIDKYPFEELYNIKQTTDRHDHTKSAKEKMAEAAARSWARPGHRIKRSKKLRETKQRRKRELGIRNPNSKLTESQVLEIRRLQGEQPQKQIAVKFGVSVQTVGFIHQRRRWAHLP